jgi:hypothetical protein
MCVPMFDPLVGLAPMDASGSDLVETILWSGWILWNSVMARCGSLGSDSLGSGHPILPSPRGHRSFGTKEGIS